MGKFLLRDALGWGVLVWLFGYVLGIVLFFLVPSAFIGLAIAPFAILFTLWVLLKRVKADAAGQFVVIALVWTVLAVLLDYLFIVRLFHPADGYYKFDVYLYYVLTLLLPLAAGWWRLRRRPSAATP